VVEETVPTRGEQGAAISNAVVAFYSEHFGRGPTKAHTHVLDDAVVCLLQDVATAQERELIEADCGDVAREARDAIRRNRAAELAAIVEGLVGRKVICMLGDFRPEHDIAALVFPLASEPPA
jgi:uncharacterized protein YbcI